MVWINKRKRKHRGKKKSVEKERVDDVNKSGGTQQVHWMMVLIHSLTHTHSHSFTFTSFIHSHTHSHTLTPFTHRSRVTLSHCSSAQLTSLLSHSHSLCHSATLTESHSLSHDSHSLTLTLTHSHSHSLRSFSLSVRMKVCEVAHPSDAYGRWGTQQIYFDVCLRVLGRPLSLNRCCTQTTWAAILRLAWIESLSTGLCM
jgi:hypothetical protein